MVSIAMGELCDIVRTEGLRQAVEKCPTAHVGAVRVINGEKKAINADHLKCAAQGWQGEIAAGGAVNVGLEVVGDGLVKIRRGMREDAAGAGIAQISAQAHQHGIRVIGATLTPYQGCGYYSDAGNQVRNAVNEWIRTSPIFDGVADFDKAVRDPENPQHFAAQYDSGDHLHPKDAGYEAMAGAIDLSLFTKKK
jgi:hypothetical protein